MAAFLIRGVKHKIPSRGTGATLAALLPALHHEARPVAQPQIERLARVYRRWRNEHRWLTSSSDLPAAALHAVRDVPVDIVAEEVERAYTSLADAGFRRGNQLQLVSHLLAVDPRGTDTGVQRFLTVVERLRAADERVGESRYDEIALLALTRGSPREVVDRIVRNRATGYAPSSRDRTRRWHSRSPRASRWPPMRRLPASATPVTWRRCSRSRRLSMPSKRP